MKVKGGAKNAGAKNFQLTLNTVEVFDDVLGYIKSLCPNYLIGCKERAPSTGHVHYHLYVQFPNSRRLSIKKLGGAHLEICRGSPEQNIAYIKKDGDIVIEEGAPRLNYMPSIKKLKEMKPEEREGLPANLYNIVKKVNDEEKKYLDPSLYYKDVKVHYIYGPSGIGKTKWCIDHMLSEGVTKFNEVKYDGHFWNGVTEDCEVCLYDDWRDSHMKPAEFINFIDYNRHILNTKGGSVRNNYKVIYITSIQDPADIYSNSKEDNLQWIRRIHCLHLGSQPPLGASINVAASPC